MKGTMKKKIKVQIAIIVSIILILEFIFSSGIIEKGIYVYKKSSYESSQSDDDLNWIISYNLFGSNTKDKLKYYPIYKEKYRKEIEYQPESMMSSVRGDYLTTLIMERNFKEFDSFFKSECSLETNGCFGRSFSLMHIPVDKILSKEEVDMFRCYLIELIEGEEVVTRDTAEYYLHLVALLRNNYFQDEFKEESDMIHELIPDVLSKLKESDTVETKKLDFINKSFCEKVSW